MGLVKFNSLTLQIEQVPDGHVIVPESEIASLRATGNSYSLLKSKIPAGVSEDQLSVLIEKGQRYDGVSQEKTTLQKQFEETTAKLKGFENIPQDFKVETWNKFKADEASRTRQSKIDALTEQVKKTVKEKHGVDLPVIDQRFIPQDRMSAFDPDSKTALDDLTKILDDAHTEQMNFVQKISSSGIPSTIPAGQAAPAAGGKPAPFENPANGDRVSATELHVGGFRI